MMEVEIYITSAVLIWYCVCGFPFLFVNWARALNAPKQSESWHSHSTDLQKFAGTLK